jgi:hypothetical protein
VRELLESEAEALRSNKEWERWFQLPFIKDPASDPAFQVGNTFYIEHILFKSPAKTLPQTPHSS